MYFNGIDKIFASLTESNTTMATDLINQGLDALNKANPLFFNDAFIENLKKNMSANHVATNKSLKLFNDYIRLYQYTACKSIGFETKPVIEAGASDRRFFDESWNENAAFDHIKQFYLLVSQFILDTVIDNEYKYDDKTAKQIDFYTKQWLDALSPSNFALTNPAVVKETIDSNGENLMQGVQALINDFSRGKGKQLMTRMTDYDAFEVVKNIATTAGAVI